MKKKYNTTWSYSELIVGVVWPETALFWPERDREEMAKIVLLPY